MKKILPIFLGLLLFALSTLFFPKSVLAEPPTGTHTFHSHYSALPLVPSNQPVTIMLFVNEIINENGSPNFNELNNLTLHLESRSPYIIRIAGMKQGNIYQRIEDHQEIENIASALTYLPGHFYVVFGNEVNNSTEWGGQIDPQGYADAYVHFYRSVADHNKIRVAPSALDPFHPNSAVSFINQVRGAWEMADAYAFNVYHVPGKEGQVSHNSYLSYLWLSQQVGLSGSKPILLTEFSLMPPSFDRNLPEVADFIAQTVGQLTGNVVAVTPLIRDPCEPSGSNAYLLYISGRIFNLEGVDVTDLPCEGLTIGNPSLICADIDLTKTNSGTEPAQPGDSPGPVAPVERNIDGNIELIKAKFPKFEDFQKRMVAGLIKLLPSELGQTLSLPGDTTLYFKHIPIGTDGSSPVACEAVPDGTEKLPGELWGRLASLRGLCGFLGEGICQPVDKFQFEIGSAYPSCDNLQRCLGEREVENLDLPPPTTGKTEFYFAAWFKKIIDWVEENITSHFTESANIGIYSRSQLPGGNELVQNSNVLRRSLPQDIIEQVEGGSTQALENPFNYEFSLSPGTEQEVEGRYYELEPMWQNYCLDLCSRLPSGTIHQFGDDICPSCNPKDYIGTSEPGADDPELNMDLCQLEEGAGCHYYDPSATQGCGPNQDPVCEGGRCNPFEYGPRQDYEGAGCTPPFSGECTKPSVCVKAHFAPNPEGGYGSCRYTHETVCVRADRVSTGNCAAVCNWQCCDY